MSAHPTRDVEETHAPPVSSLRTKFEQLTLDASAAKGSFKPSFGHDLLVPEPGSPRPRASSASNETKPSPRLLRAASSSSDLKVEDKKPPPPPPPRGSQVNSPAHSATASPLLRPAPSSPSSSPTPLSLEAKQALLARKPPPPPPSGLRAEPQETSNTAGVSALIHKFGNVTPALPSSKPAIHSSRVVSHSSITIHSMASNSSLLSDSNQVSDAPRAPRHSFPQHNTPSTTPRIVFPDPFDDLSEPQSVSSARPPPLPNRRNDHARRPPANIDHSRGQSSDSITTVITDSSSTSPAESNSPLELISSPVTTPSRNPPPRPPPRPKNAVLPKQSSLPTVASPSPMSVIPPPLPARKNTGFVAEEPRARIPPPPRHHSVSELDVSAPSNSAPPLIPTAGQNETSNAPSVSPPTIAPASAVQPMERKTFGAHLPPPTRTIALGGKLPPARRQPSGSSSDEEEEEPLKKIDLLPDSSRSSRRPPTLKIHSYSESYIHIPAYTGVVVVAGSLVVVSSGHHLKVYDLSQSDSPVHDLDPRGMGMETKTKDFKITSMEFRPAARDADRGCYLWVGTKDGHLFELDVRAGLVVGMKLAIHSHAVTHMCRYGNQMVTLDETGKALVFTPDSPDADPGLSATQPRVVRIADKQEFVKIIGGKLWTSARDPSGSNAGNTSRGPIVRVYDIFVPGAAGRSILPTEHLGAVTSGTVLQSQPGQVFLGHEGGNVSIWALDTEDGIPACQEVIKVSTSDILCLEGVNNRLWAGGRKGTIAAYDVAHRPWVVTNNWQAHQKLPVLRLVVDTWSIEKLGRLVVYSAGRDERLRFWDGLLGIDWIDQELLKRETEYSSFREMKVLLVSWNIDSSKPDALNGIPENINFLHNVLSSVDSPDIISFGLQEVIDLESRKMAAKSVLLGGKSRTTDGAISQRVTTSYKKWYDRLILAVRLAMPPDTPYTVVHTENLVGLFSCIFVKDTQRNSLRDIALTTIKRGMGGRYGNKGGIIARMVIDDSSICFINCHLAAGQHHVRQRNADVAAFLEEELFPESHDLGPYVNGGDGTLVLDHEIVFLSGDMNYRIDLRREPVVADIQKGDYSRLILQDQLLKEMKNNRGFRLRGFSEGPLDFAPTYKYDRRSDEYDSSEKRRVPAWCDRVLWRSREPSRIEQLHYRRYEANISDHRPISSAFRMTVKSIAPERREPVKAEVAALWTQQEVTLLETAYQFYASQSMV